MQNSMVIVLYDPEMKRDQAEPPAAAAASRSSTRRASRTRAFSAKRIFE